MCPRNVDICLFPGLAALIRQNCKPHRVDPMIFFQRPWLAREEIRTVPQIQKEVTAFSSQFVDPKKLPGEKVFPKNT